MRILQLTARRTSIIRDVATPQPGPGDVLMRVNAITTCPQWDLHLWHNDPMFVGHSLSFPMQWGNPGMRQPASSKRWGRGHTPST